MNARDSINLSRLPYTGAQYIESLRDERNVYLDGKRISDVTAHPAFRNSVRSVARLYDALHDSDTSGLLTTSLGGGFTQRAFKPAASAEDLRAQRDAYAAWARLTYGWMGRSPDFKGALVSTFGANPDFYGPYAENARRWYAKAAESVLFLNHAIVNPPVDRSRPAEVVRDVYVSVQKETDAGIYVSGAKVVATGSVLTQHSFVGQGGTSATDGEDLAMMFMLPMNHPGCKLICRTSYEANANASATPFDYPLSSRFDENDAIFVLDNVFVPWEDVIVYRDLDRVRRFYQGSGFMQGFCLQACTRYAVKLDFLAGLVAKALRTTGGGVFRGNQVLLGEIVGLRNKFWAFADAMVGNPERWVDGKFLPNLNAALSYRMFAPNAVPRIREIVQKVIASALIYLPATSRDFENPEIDKYLRKYVRGSGGIGYKERIKVLKLLWDATCSEFGGRHELYERNYAGNHEEVRLQVLLTAERTGQMQQMEELVDRCMADYDEQGWAPGSAWAAGLRETTGL